ncbi:hypothetical protein [Roseovarius mucosus]|uniref:hypothetical protein n=1 Tax=Roseovarius mucosus TaxID=215743 RepID=UPI003F7164B3
MPWQPSDLLKRPPDWVDFSEQWRRVKEGTAFAGKTPPIYKSEDGFEYWVEAECQKIRTSDPTIFMSFHGWCAHGYEGHHYAMLHDRGDRIVITSKPNDRQTVCFAHDLADKTEDGAQIWHVDELFRRFIIPDHESYPWVTSAGYLPMVEIVGLNGFRDRQHQERVIRLIETLLSCRGGADLAALRGETTRGKVVFGQKLLDQLERGALIVGNS